MPKKTFLNLSDDQQKKIIGIALKEFSDHDYESASMNSIIKSSDVTKGGFYRYFESKRELYDFLIEHASEKKLAFMKNSVIPDNGDFFEQLRSMMYSYLFFDLTFPDFGKFLLKAATHSNETEAFLKEAISRALKNGLLNSEFDRDFIYCCTIKVMEAVQDYICVISGTDREKLISLEPTADISNDKELENIFNKAIAFLRHGFGIKQ